MCGICGLFYADATRRPDRAEIEGMTRCLAHRGPDDEGYFIGPGVAFGHRRLRVIDPAGGEQPMSDPGGRITISFNGEIYNFRQLRAELERLGARFRTRSDTEVLLWGYHRWGEGLLDRLVGMFALAVWDAGAGTLLLARDRLGKKPLCWTRLPDGGIAFASELSGLVACRDVKPTLDRDAVTAYVALGYVPGEQGILEGVQRLAPGGGLRVRRGRPPQAFTWWNLAEIWRRRPRDERPRQEIEMQFSDLLDTAVRDRLVSDVPLGAFLSGGLDSSTIVALMSRHLPTVETFSIGFEESNYSELPHARRAAGFLGTTHCDQTVRGDDPDLLVEIASRLDEPFADTSLIPTYVLCRMARQRVTVVLSGDGGDELLAGYVTHLADALRRGVDRLPRVVPALARRAVGLLPDSRRKVNAIFKAKQFFAGAHLDACDAHAWWRTLAGAEQVRRLVPAFAGDVAPSFAPARRAWDEAHGLTPLDRILYVDFRTWLPDDILFKADRMSMAHGLEVRSPFLDHRLVEFCCGLPDRYKLHAGRGKRILRRAARGLVPQAAITRRKAGFSAPVGHWLAGPWRPVAEAALAEGSLGKAGLIDTAEARRLLEEHAAGRREHGHLLFTLVMLGLWLDRVQPSAA